MLNVIISEFYKIFKSKIFMILSIVLLTMFALILASNIYYGEEARQLSTGISSYQEVYGQDITYYLILIFVTFLITNEYANGTIRQMACHGLARWKLVVGQYIAMYFAIVLILLIFGVSYSLVSTIFNQFGEVNLIALLSMSIGTLCMFFGIAGMGTLLSYLFKNGVAAILISILFVLSKDLLAYFLKALTKNSIFTRYSFSNMRRIILDYTSSPKEVFICSGVFLALGIMTIVGSCILFSKLDID